MEKNEDFKRLVDFIVKEYWGDKKKMTLDTQLEKDLGITGDDGIEFLEKFLDHFDIKYDENRKWQLHFGSEGFSIINFMRIYDFILGNKKRKQFDLTLGHLLRIIRLGYWIDMEE